MSSTSRLTFESLLLDLSVTEEEEDDSDACSRFWMPAVYVFFASAKRDALNKEFPFSLRSAAAETLLGILEYLFENFCRSCRLTNRIYTDSDVQEYGLLRQLYVLCDERSDERY